jgi:hypothetical protein
MANPFAGIITSEFKQTFDDAINALLLESALTIPCTLVFENTKLNDCPNCIYDSISRRSSNQYEIGGPIPFVNGQICPYCNGVGSLSFNSEEVVHLGIIKPVFFGIDKLNLQDINFVDGKIQSLCSVDLYEKLKNASVIIVDNNLLNLANNRYIRYRDPIPVGFGNNSFIITTWQAVE